MHPHRFRTGYKNTTIPNPARLNNYLGMRNFEGDVVGYNFEKQADNFRQLQEVLNPNGIHFTTIASTHYTGDCHTNHRFVVLTDNPAVIWVKYVGYAAQGGQNHLYIHGRRIKVSVLLRCTPEQQTALLHNNERQLAYEFTPDRLRLINESGTLWN